MSQTNPIDKLIFKYFENKASESDTKQLSAWLDENQLNRNYFSYLKSIYIEIQAGLSGNKINFEVPFRNFIERIQEYDSKNKQGERKGHNSLIFKLFRYAALVILALGFGIVGYLLGHRNLSPVDTGTTEIVVPYGGKSAVSLSDGSKVWLNAGSVLRYEQQYNSKTRDVYLEGEAFFEVQKDERTFVVHTSYLDIKALGTSFNVKSYPEDDKVETTLVDGEVQVDSRQTVKHFILKPSQKLTLTIPEKTIRDKNIDFQNREPLSGGNVSVSADGSGLSLQDIQIKMISNTRESVSWKDGDLVINKETLEELTKKLERKYDVTFVFKNEALKKYTYSGTLRDFPLEQVLKALQLTSPVKCSINEKLIKLDYNNDFKLFSMKK